MNISYVPWSLRGCTEKVYMAYVEIPKSNSLSYLRKLQEQLNNPPVKGIVLLENPSKALERLGWEKLDEGLYFRCFE